MRMKQALILVILYFCSYSLWAQNMDFSERYHYFYDIDESSGEVFHDFDFMNTGEKPIVIKEVVVSCGCMASEWPRLAVQPGEKAKVRLSYHPANRHETEFLGVAEVYTNVGMVELKIEGKVKREQHELPIDYQLNAESHACPEKKRSTQNDFELILDRMRAELLQQVRADKNDALVLQQVGKLRRGGYWQDIDYQCYTRTNWEPIRHLERVRGMSLAYVHPESTWFANDTLFVAIRDALGYWLEKSSKSHNWWYNQIAVPQRLGDILVLLSAGQRNLPAEIQQGLFGLMAWPDPRKWTGANKQDIALHHLQRGCLLKNDSIVGVAVEQMFYPVRFTNREGLQADYSYQQHDNQLYIGGYGTVFVGCVVRTAGWLRDTPYALGDEQLQIFSRFMRETYLNVLRGPYMDYSVMGRGISRKGATYAHGMPQLMEKMKSLDPVHAQEYEKAKTRFQSDSTMLREDFNRIYWRSDYALHNRKAFDFSVRTSSVRTCKIEGGNGENLLGGLLSDGATSVRVSGDEYFDIFPLWNWNHIPGVTALENGNELKPANWGQKGKTVFSGGVSDGHYGAMAYDLNDSGIKARKAWFMFDQEVVCLGAGISRKTGGKVITTVEQTRFKGVKTAGNSIFHNHILYYFPEGNFRDSVVPVKQKSWADINYNQSLKWLKGDIYHLYIDHGERPDDAGYAYILVPGLTECSDYDTSAVSIVRNDSRVQAVYQKELDVLQVVCYEAGRFEGQNIVLEVNIPCVLMVRGVDSQDPELYLADPMQDKKEVRIGLENGGKRVEKTVRLPEGDMKGSTIKIEIR